MADQVAAPIVKKKKDIIFKPSLLLYGFRQHLSTDSLTSFVKGFQKVIFLFFLSLPLLPNSFSYITLFRAGISYVFISIPVKSLLLSCPEPFVADRPRRRAGREGGQTSS